MKSNLPSALHNYSAFAVAAIGSIAAWNWAGIMSAHTAGIIVTGLGVAKLVAGMLAGTSDA